MSDAVHDRRLRGGRLAVVLAVAAVVLVVIVLHLTGAVGPLAD
jgi:hypothetical protein